MARRIENFEAQLADGNFVAIVYVDVNMGRRRLGVHDDFRSYEFFKVVAGAAVVRVSVGVDDRFESKPFIGEKRKVSINLLANRIDQNGHMILFAADEVGFAFAAVEFTKQHYDLLIFNPFNVLNGEPFEHSTYP